MYVTSDIYSRNSVSQLNETSLVTKEQQRSFSTVINMIRELRNTWARLFTMGLCRFIVSREGFRLVVGMYVGT